MGGVGGDGEGGWRWMGRRGWLGWGGGGVETCVVGVELVGGRVG